MKGWSIEQQREISLSATFRRGQQLPEGVGHVSARVGGPGGVELSDRRSDPFGCGVPLARGDRLAGVADLAQTRGLNQGIAVQQLRVSVGFGSRSVEFTVVILSEQVGSYPKINWTEWKDRNRKQMKSQGDVWSMATLSGATIWDCLDNNKIDRLHLVQWKPDDDTMYQVSLPRR